MQDPDDGIVSLRELLERCESQVRLLSANHVCVSDRGRHGDFVTLAVMVAAECGIEMPMGPRYNAFAANLSEYEAWVPRWLVTACEAVMRDGKPITYLARLAALVRRLDPVARRMLLEHGWNEKLLEGSS